MSKILITGGTGLIGSALVDELLKSSVTPIVLTRQAESLKSASHSIQFIRQLDDIDSSEEIRAVINLAGEPIADKLWSAPRKVLLENSRISTTKNLIRLFERLNEKPEVFISGSAVGYYGNSEDEVINESSSGNNCYSHQLCKRWENEAKSAENLGIRTCILRTGLVISSKKGFLKKMLPAFRFGLGGKLGTGRQWMSWVHIDDMIQIIQHLRNTPSSHGIYNATSPNPVTNGEFSQQLAKKLQKPCFISTPAFVLKFVFGEMSQLLLEGQRVIPEKLLQEGFQFQHKSLPETLNYTLSGDKF